MFHKKIEVRAFTKSSVIVLLNEVYCIVKKAEMFL